MEKFEFTCPHCKEKFEAQEDWCDMEAECPNCNNSVTINKPSLVSSTAASKETDESSKNKIKIKATHCELCNKKLSLFNRDLVKKNLCNPCAQKGRNNKYQEAKEKRIQKNKERKNKYVEKKQASSTQDPAALKKKQTKDGLRGCLVIIIILIVIGFFMNQCNTDKTLNINAVSISKYLRNNGFKYQEKEDEKYWSSKNLTNMSFAKSTYTTTKGKTRFNCPMVGFLFNSKKQITSLSILLAPQYYDRNMMTKLTLQARKDSNTNSNSHYKDRVAANVKAMGNWFKYLKKCQRDVFDKLKVEAAILYKMYPEESKTFDSFFDEVKLQGFDKIYNKEVNGIRYEKKYRNISIKISGIIEKLIISIDPI